jgi:TRAP-type C4-dicarboxylate transport system substrate-binding protein
LRTKRLWGLLVSMCLILVVATPAMVGCAPGAEEPSGYGTWRYGDIHALDAPAAVMAEELIDLLAERSDGRIKIEYYGNCQLGDWTEIFENVMVGTCDMGCTPAVDSYDPRLGIDWAPYRFLTWDQAREAYEPGGWIFTILEDIYESNNIKFLGYGFRGFTGVSLNECPSVLPPEPCGIKIRTVPISSWKKAWETMGYLPVAIPYAEVYTSIQTGVVEGQAGGGSEQMYLLVGDIQGCWIQTNDWMDNQPIGMNLDLWNSIAPQDQELILDTIEEVLWEPGGFNDQQQELEAVWRDKALADYGIESIILDEAQLAKCAKAVREAVWPDMEAAIGSVVYDKMLEMCPPV